MTTMFTLTNEQRKYLGLQAIEDHWEVMDIKGTRYYFDGDIIRKEIMTAGYHEDSFFYCEQELYVETAEHKTIVLPKTAKGKPKKLNLSATTSFHPIGMYFSYNTHIEIGNHTTQKTYYTKQVKGKNPTLELETWLQEWIRETTPEDQKELEQFKHEQRTHQKYKEGDIFTFKIGRRQYGFGKILIDIVKRRKTEAYKQQKHAGLNHLMGTALYMKVYRTIKDTLDLDLDELNSMPSLPAQAMMDNKIYYGEYKILGNRAVCLSELTELPITVSHSIDISEPDYAYLQYGLIYREISRMEYELYEDERWYDKDYRDESIGFSVSIDDVKACIQANSNEPYYQKHRQGKLNNPYNQNDKNRIFEIFGLQGTLGYEENLNIDTADKSPE